MIDDKLREQLSSLLDNQLSPAQRRALEEKIQNDPAVRAEWDALRKFSGVIANTVPPPVQAPPDFRARIMDRLQAAPGGGPGSAGAGGAAGGAAGLSLFSKISLPAYLVAGTVLAGLVGTMVYLDFRQAQKPAPRPLVQSGELPALAVPTAAKAAPEYRGTQTVVSQKDIQGASAAPVPPAVMKMTGGVYTIGQGGARRAGSVVSQPWNPGSPEPGVDLALDGSLSRQTAGLESTASWTNARVQQVLELTQVPSSSASQVMGLAQKNHLNPGLLCAALQEFPGRPAGELALALRTSLNASVKLPEDARLQKCVQDLGGKPAAAAKWKKALQP